ncbi:efflux RND transporter periplasmic adaptor subunit [Daejeonella sp. H1SJ63]|uniref:efflux RND transporter periplasmic adaptor subunit n=1 Tax=Daejeonella sp. H1SJ63 TaxID=3034145 RepID=UPI0023EAE620|nr:efflux RND transporter periplasmic adaptor subunit [Daejeonella sp. H1SJ63]
MKNIFIILSLFIITSCGSKNSTEVTAEAPAQETESIVTLSDTQLKSTEISVSKLEQKAISSVIKVNGSIDVPPQNIVSVSIPMGGYLKSTKLLPGMPIRKNETIAMIEDQQYIQMQEDYLTTKSKLAYSKSELDRQKELNASKASSDKVYQQTQMEYNTLKIMLSSLEQKLKMININPNSVSESNITRTVSIQSPINGFVSKVNVNIGKYVSPTDVLFEIIDPSTIHLNLKVFEKDLNKLSIGQKLIAYSNSNEEKKYSGEISLISNDLSPERIAEVHCHFENPDKSLKPGMYMNAEIELMSHNTLAIAEEAIVNFEGKDYVFVKKSDKEFEMLQVGTGVKENKFIEITNSEKFTNREIVIKGAYTLLMTLKNKSEE